MKSNQICIIGVILFLIGLNFLFVSWYFTYPIYIPKLNEITFTQFHPFIWSGIILMIIGSFLTGYYSKRKSVKAICASFFPLILYVYVFYFYYIPSSDSGNVKSMFEVFHHVGIDSTIVSYFQYPTYFSLNEITNLLLGVDVNSTAIIFFTLYGFLLGLYLFLFLNKITKNNRYQIAFIAVPIYFTTLSSYLNYQWVPQTLALIFFFLLIISFNRREIEYKFLNLIIFIAFIFTHAFIPIIFLFFLGLYTYKKKEMFNYFLLMSCIYISVLIFYTTYYFPVIVDAFKETIYGFGGEYSTAISKTFKETTGVLDQIISIINRVRIPLTLLIISIGFFIGIIKKKLNFIAIILAITGGSYLILGLVFPVLGLRSIQIIGISLVLGIGFYISKWNKKTLFFIVILLVLSVFGPMRASYDQTQFLLNEEENTCRFLATVSPNQQLEVGVSQVNWGYFTNIYQYIKDQPVFAFRPSSPKFYHIFNRSMEKNEFLIYNPNIGKEIKEQGIIPTNNNTFIEIIFFNNRIYSCNKTYILNST